MGEAKSSGRLDVGLLVAVRCWSAACVCGAPGRLLSGGTEIADSGCVSDDVLCEAGSALEHGDNVNCPKVAFAS
jgi:hypothetical protein